MHSTSVEGLYTITPRRGVVLDHPHALAAASPSSLVCQVTPDLAAEAGPRNAEGSGDGEGAGAAPAPPSRGWH